ncbi:hypothetical protein FEV13_00290 (plasmid) [Stutzerimonas degradans]|nr:hypothetical protein FEV13_00290 [Stutzerimonas degradans]
MGGRITVESVVRCSWNGWPDDREIRRLELGVSITAAVNPSVVSLRQEGISSYCGQICGGGSCGAGQLCSFGINSESQMPGLPEGDPNQGQFQLSLMVA